MLSLKGCFLITDVPFTSSCSLFYGLHALVSLRVRASSELDLETVPFSLFPAFRRVCGERGEELPEASIAGHLLLSPCHPGRLAEAAFVVLHGAKRQLCAFCERCRASAASKSLRAPGFASDRVGSCWFCDVDTLPFKGVLQRCPQLQYLDISNSAQLTDATLCHCALCTDRKSV